MVRQSGQLQLVFSRSMSCSSKPLRMSLSSSQTRSTKRQLQESPFLAKMRELERLSPGHARALGVMADGIFERLLGAQLK